MTNPPSNSEVCPTCGRFYTTYITHGSAQPPTPECSDPFHAGDSQLTDQGVRERLRDVVFAEVKSRVFHAAETKSSILEHHAQMVWKRIEPYLDQISAEREKQTILGSEPDGWLGMIYGSLGPHLSITDHGVTLNLPVTKEQSIQIDEWGKKVKWAQGAAKAALRQLAGEDSKR